MNIRIKRVDRTLPLPEYQSKGAAAMDLAARETISLKPKEIRYIPLNIILEIPEHCWVLIAPRSSAHKLGIMQANGICIGDSDFCGEKDEYHFAAYNFTEREVVIERGARIAQMMILAHTRITLEEVDSVQKESRGGFGTTGVK